MLKLIAVFALLATSSLAAPPPVLLSGEHSQMCAVKVGDALPALALTTPTAASVKWADQLGAKATVVAIHKGEGWMAKGLRKDLAGDVAGPLAAKGVKAFAIAIGSAGPPTEGLTTLVDSQGAETVKLGVGRLPRVYVLDSAGKIVWFDIEYTNSSRREMKAALDSLLGE